MHAALYETQFSGIPLLKRGKVRDIYDLGETLLLVATDRISAFDVIMPEPIPDKGRILTAISLFWFDVMADLIPNHLITSDVSRYPEACLPYAKTLAGRSMVVKKAEPLPIECVVRGYLYGSSWKEYAAGGGPTTEHLPTGLQMADRLPEPIFTPATKAESGHDENLTEAEARDYVGDTMYEELRRRSIAIYRNGTEYAAERGIILADTKFEFGRVGDEIILIDEVLTPDSSRYWPADAWAPGATMPSFDKQPVRDWLETQDWDKTPPAPPLPDEVVTNTVQRYTDVYERLTGKPFGVYLEEVGAER